MQPIPSTSLEVPSAEYGVNHDCCGTVYPRDCLDLAKDFESYQIRYEDPAFKGSRCPWHREIICRHGSIAPNGGTGLYAISTGRIRARIRDLSLSDPARFKLTQDGDLECSIVFDVEDFTAVATILKAQRR